MRGTTIQIIIASIVWSLWLLLLGPAEALTNVKHHMTIALTMLLGSFVAGSTSVGGGAVAFPVFTKILHIDSNTALIFSLAIQSIGMTAASLLIYFHKIPICLRIIRYSVIAGGSGFVAGFFMIRTHITGADIKYIFSCFSVIVAIGLLWIQFGKHQYSASEQTPATLPLILACFLGGILSGLIGTGIDFILFSLMLFLWHYDFKKAIATSVVIMAINALIGFIFIVSMTNEFQGEVVSYWQAAIPIVVVGAPLGALACKYINKNIMLYFLLILIAIDIVSTVVILGIRFDYLLVLAIVLIALIYYKKITTKPML